MFPPTSTAPQNPRLAPIRTQRMSLSPPLRSAAPAANRLSLPPLPTIRISALTLSPLSLHSKTPTHDSSPSSSYLHDHRNPCRTRVKRRPSSPEGISFDLDFTGRAVKETQVTTPPGSARGHWLPPKIEAMAQADAVVVSVGLGEALTPDLEGEMTLSPPPPNGVRLFGSPMATLLTPPDEASEFLPSVTIVGGTDAGVGLGIGIILGKDGAYDLGIDDRDAVESADADMDKRKVLRCLSASSVEDPHRSTTLSILSPVSSTCTSPSPQPDCSSLDHIGVPHMGPTYRTVQSDGVLHSPPSASTAARHSMRPLLLVSRRNFNTATAIPTSHMLFTSPKPPGRSASAYPSPSRDDPALRGLGFSVGLGPLDSPPRQLLLATRVAPAASTDIVEVDEQNYPLFRFGGNSDSTASQGGSDTENDSVTCCPVRLPSTVSAALASLASALTPPHLHSPSRGFSHTIEPNTSLKSCLRGKRVVHGGDRATGRVRWAQMLVECEPVGEEKTVGPRMMVPSSVCADGSPTKSQRFSRRRLVTLRTTTVAATNAVRRTPAPLPQKHANLPLRLLLELFAFVSAAVALSKWTVILLAKMWIMVCAVYKGMVTETVKPSVGVRKIKSRSRSQASMPAAEL